MTIIVHHLNNSRSQRILWLLEEMGIDYEIKKYERLESKLAPPELVAIHPTGKAPLITDTANGKNKVIAESGAIVEYLIRNYGNGGFVPADPERIDDETFFNHFAEGSLMPMLVMKLVFNIFPNQMPFYIRFFGRAIAAGVNSSYIDPDLKRKTQFIGDYLDKNADGGRGFFTGGDKDGKPTGADFQMFFPLEGMMAGRVQNPPECIKAYIDMVHSRPAYKRALERGGPFQVTG